MTNMKEVAKAYEELTGESLKAVIKFKGDKDFAISGWESALQVDRVFTYHIDAVDDLLRFRVKPVAPELKAEKPLFIVLDMAELSAKEAALMMQGAAYGYSFALTNP